MTKATHQIVAYLCQPAASNEVSKATGAREDQIAKVAKCISAGDGEVAKAGLNAYLVFLRKNKPAKTHAARPMWKEQKDLAKAALALLEGDIAKAAAVTLGDRRDVQPTGTKQEAKPNREDYEQAQRDFLKVPSARNINGGKL